MEHMTGKTKDVGWEVGVRKTVHQPAPQVWEFLTTHPGLHVWFGDDPDFTFKKGEVFKTKYAIGHVNSYTDGTVMRLTWQMPGHHTPSVLQIRVIPAGEHRSTISFHQEKLQSAAQRKAMQKHWQDVIKRLEAIM